MKNFRLRNADCGMIKNYCGLRFADFGKAVAVALFAVIIMGFTGTANATLTAKANHDHITIDFFYHGSTVGVKGIADAGTDLVVKITSPEGHQMLKKKGKVAGALWMNVGTLSFEATPNLYEVFSTKKLDDILSLDERNKYVIGYDALKNHVEVKPVANNEEKTTWFNEFVKFKEDSRLYLTSSEGLNTTPAANGLQDYFIQTQWPYQAQPGDYLVTVYAVKDGKVIEQAESKVNVEQIGLVKTLATMAANSPAIYGFLSIGVALGAGFGVGMIFRKGGGAH